MRPRCVLHGHMEDVFLGSATTLTDNRCFHLQIRCGTDQHGGVIQPWGTVSVRGVFGPRKRGLRFATDNLTDCYGAHTEASHRRHPQASSRPRKER
ncbi:hypothetical protein ACOMHN_043207 [Nucella lapillus]